MSATVSQQLAVTQIVHAYHEWSNNRNAENCVFSANFKSYTADTGNDSRDNISKSTAYTNIKTDKRLCQSFYVYNFTRLLKVIHNLVGS